MISLDHRYQQGGPLKEIWSRCFTCPPHGTLLPQRILLAEPDCERLAARGHVLEHCGYEVLSCCGIQSFRRCLRGMAHFPNCRQFVNLIICDAHLLDDAVVECIRSGQENPDFPPLLLIAKSGDAQTNKHLKKIKHNGTLESTAAPQGQVLLVRRWAPY